MQTHLIIIISILFLLGIVTGLIAYIRLYNKRAAIKRQEGIKYMAEGLKDSMTYEAGTGKSQRIKEDIDSKYSKYSKRALLLEDTVILVGDHEMPYELMMSLEPQTPVYIKYYNEYRPMIVLMYKHEVGYVLVPRDEEGEPRFYPYFKVFIAIPRKEFVTGFIRSKEGEDDVFIINGVAHEANVTMDTIHEFNATSKLDDYDISKEE